MVRITKSNKVIPAFISSARFWKRRHFLAHSNGELVNDDKKMDFYRPYLRKNGGTT